MYLQLIVLLLHGPSSRAVSGSRVWKGWLGLFPMSSPSIPGTALSAAPSVPFWPAAPTSPGEWFHFSASSSQTLPLVLGGTVLRGGHMQLPLSPLQEEELESASRPCQLALLTRPVEGATEKCLAGGCCSLAWWVLWEGSISLSCAPAFALVHRPGWTLFLLLQLCSSSWPLSASAGTTSILSRFPNLLPTAVVAEGANGPGSLAPPPSCGSMLGG